MPPPMSTADLISLAQQHLAARNFKAAHAACMDALQRDPRAAAAYFLLGVLTSEHANHAKALDLFDRALALDDRDGRVHAWKGRSLIALNRRSDALHSAEQAAACPNAGAQTLDTIGVIYSRAGLHARATEFYLRATALDPGRADYWYNLAVAEQFEGQLDAARAAFRRCTSLDSAHVKAWSSLAQLTRQTRQANDIAALQSLFARMTDAEDRLHIGHAIAKAFEDIGEPGQSMEWLARAKAGKRQQLADRSPQDRALFEAAARTLDGGARSGCADPSPIFIVGLPRTGTTLVDRILSCHADVRSAGELTDLALALKQASGTPSRYVLDSETLDAAGGVDLAAIAEDYLRAARRIVPDAARFIDKMPLNFFCAGIIAQALPNARIICLRRHPADSVLSNYRQLFATGFSYYNYAFDLAQTADYYVRFDRLISRFAGALAPDRFMQVAYEDIVSDLEAQARRLVAFCGLDWDPACLAFHQNTAPVATASSVQVRERLYSSSVGRWRAYRASLAPALDVLGAAGLLETS